MFFSSASLKIAIDLSVMCNMGRRREEHNDSGNKTFWTFAWHSGYRSLNAMRCDGDRSALKVTEKGESLGDIYNHSDKSEKKEQTFPNLCMSRFPRRTPVVVCSQGQTDGVVLSLVP